MKPATKAQLSKIHVMLSQMRLLDEKASFVSQYTNGRETSSKDMSMDEATELIKYLSRFDPCDKMRRKVFALAYECGIIYGDTPDDKKMNAAKLNSFIRAHGTVKKELHKMTSAELVKVVSQFEQIKKHMAESSGNKAITAMLAGMNIQTTPARQTTRS